MAGDAKWPSWNIRLYLDYMRTSEIKPEKSGVCGSAAREFKFIDQNWATDPSDACDS